MVVVMVSANTIIHALHCSFLLWRKESQCVSPQQHSRLKCELLEHQCSVHSNGDTVQRGPVNAAALLDIA
jgi:hypothetical protein